jgi:hypothetical protein
MRTKLHRFLHGLVRRTPHPSGLVLVLLRPVVKFTNNEEWQVTYLRVNTIGGRYESENS